MKSEFLTELSAKLIKGDKVWKLTRNLIYQSGSLDYRIVVPKGFETDLASVPHVPFIYLLWGGKAHREGIVHDYLYRKDSVPPCTKQQADKVFLEAMETRHKSFFVRWPMYLGVKFGGAGSWHQRKVKDKWEEA